ncbi:MAG: PDZ domain-containing protein [Planctomycetota bacterium]
MTPPSPAANRPVCTLLALLLASAAPRAQEETLLLQEPTVSAEHVVFHYAGDLWVTGRAGGDARRLTSSPGTELSPQLSPDGEWVAFTGEYEGNADVYVISIDGGVPQRLTWHPGRDSVVDWHPDGRRVLFASRRSSGPPVSKLFLAKLGGGMPTELDVPKVAHASFDDDASHLAYTPVRDAFRSWKRYRGGRTPSIWVYDVVSHEVEVVPHQNATDTFPCWAGGAVYFASDRDGVMNVYRYAPGGGEVEQLTRFTDFDVRNLNAGGGAVVFEQGGALHLLDPATGASERLSIRVRSDGLAALPRWQSARGHVRNASLAPNGKRAVFEARGEILTLPREHGDVRNLSDSPGAHDRDPSWSNDGDRIAWFSDASGEYRLIVQDHQGFEEPRSYDLNGGGFYRAPTWSPDDEHVLFVDKKNRISYLTLETGAVTEVAQLQGSLGEVRPLAVWSPDSKWIAYEHRNPETIYDRIALFEVASGSTTLLTDGFGFADDPAFSPDGKHLYFQASVEYGPNLFGLDMSTSASRRPEANLYVAVLQRDGENPLAPRSDEAFEDEEEEEEEEAEESDEGADDAESEEEEEEEEEEGSDLPALDPEGLDQRILALPTGSGQYDSLAGTESGLMYIERHAGSEPELKLFELEKREAKTLTKGVSSFELSADGKWILTRKSGRYAIAKAGGEDPKSLDVDGVMVRVEPELEWPQMLREVWRIQRDYFYDPNMHGVDWVAMWDRWDDFLPHVRHRDDLTVLIRELIGELACGHQYASGGETPDAPDGVSVGLLGADLAYDRSAGAFRIERILRGQNWNADLRAPLTEPGVDAREGDYLLAVNGRPVDPGQNVYRAFENTAGKQVRLTLAETADGADSRTVTVVPIGSESRLRRQAWVEANRRRVDELSGGRLAYIYMPNTGGAGREAFDRDFYSQLDKEGVVLDERYNGGGQVANYVIDVLSREPMSYWMNREAWVGRSPFGMIEGPKVMIVNESAGSGGDWMPWVFQNKGLGPLVGTRTWGGLVGISGYPPLMDGGSVTAASFGVMDVEGQWAVENVGVAPDFEVIEWPAEILAGRDPQLERAVELALGQLGGARPAPASYHPPQTR